MDLGSSLKNGNSVKQKKLLVQMSSILIPLFFFMLFIVSQAVYQGTINGYLKAQHNLMEERLNSLHQNLFYTDDSIDLMNVWSMNYMEANPEICTLPITEAERDAFMKIADNTIEYTDPDWGNLTEDASSFLAKAEYQSLYKYLRLDAGQYGSYKLFLVDINEPHRGFIFDWFGNEDKEAYSLGDTLEFSIQDHPALRSLVADPSSRTEFERVNDFPEKGNYYIAYKPVLHEGEIRAVLVLAYSWSGLRQAMSGILFKAFLAGIGGLLVSLAILLALLYKKAIAPVKNIQESIQTYIRTKDSAAVTVNLDKIRERNEIGQLSDDLSKMVREIDHYTAENIQMAEEREKVNTELTLASAIQNSMLPKDFPHHSSFSLYASMTPAKEVGGDFYDFYYLDEEHLALVIADVSGKGIPAALFMMMCKNMIKNYAREGLTPSEILERTNRSILESKQNTMFVTVWFGIYNISTGHITAVNAGHEYPILRKADSGFELFKDRHGFIVGGLEGIHYRNYEFDLEAGGTLFLYTDGITEATDSDEELYGTGRMLELLNRDPDGSPEELIRNMKTSIDAFVGAAPQFDDITMLVIRRSSL